MQCCAPNSTTGRRDAACLQHQLRLLIAGEGLTPLTDRANQAKETAFQCERLRGGERSGANFSNLPVRGRHLVPITTEWGKATNCTAKPAWELSAADVERWCSTSMLHAAKCEEPQAWCCQQRPMKASPQQAQVYFGARTTLGLL